MPIQITCSRCGTILGEFDKLPLSRDVHGRFHVSPAKRVIEQNGGKCPNCGKKLETDVNKQQVSVSAFNPYVEAIT